MLASKLDFRTESHAVIFCVLVSNFIILYTPNGRCWNANKEGYEICATIHFWLKKYGHDSDHTKIFQWSRIEPLGHVLCDQYDGQTMIKKCHISIMCMKKLCLVYI
jgi:hypothetical protein